MSRKLGKMRVSVAAALLATVALGACGNDSNVQRTKQVFGGVFDGLLKKKGPAGKAVPLEQQMAQVLSGTTQPVVLASIENRGASAFLLEIERNLSYATYATAQKQTLVLRHGLLSGSRGFGADLMSTDLAGSEALVRARSAGSSQRKMRYLDGEDQTFTYSFNCTMSVGKTQDVQSGLIATRATRMTESCKSETREFENTYVVDKSGFVIASRQWFGPLNGYIAISQLRK